MIKQINRKEQTQKRHRRVRLKIAGTSEYPRLAVYRSIKHIYAQIIDDTKGVTLVSSSSKVKELGLKHGGNIEAAKVVGADLAKKALEKTEQELKKLEKNSFDKDVSKIADMLSKNQIQKNFQKH